MKEKEYYFYRDKFKTAFNNTGNNTDVPFTNGQYILKGDVSGIQDFIFNIQSDGASRMLTARSFFIQVCAQLCIEKILSICSLNREKNMISDRGGSFFIGLDKEPDEQLKNIGKEVNSDLDIFGLYISMAWVKAEDTWSNTLDALMAQEERQKFQRYHNNPEAFVPFLSPGKKERIFDTESEAEPWLDFAKNLSQSKGYCIEKTNESNPAISNDSVILFGLKFKLIQEEDAYIQRLFEDPEYALMNEFPLWRKCNPYFDNMEKYEQDERELKQHKDKDYRKPKLNEIIDLDHLALQAKMRTGSDQLGVMKLDVDDMGNMFKKTFNTQSRFKDASEALGFFWGLHLKNIWKEEKFRDLNNQPHAFRDNILIVYAGGDDCFLLGGWDAILHFASRFKKEFDDFFDEKITFSASVLLLQATTPVIQIGLLAEKELEHAKHFENNRKNSVSLFGEVFTWKEFDKICSLSHILFLLIKGNKRHAPESKALLQKIRLSARGYDALMKNMKLKNQVNFQKVWNLTWFILRGVQKENRDIVDRKIVSKYYDAVQTALTTQEYASALVYPAAARITELLTRKI